MIGIAITAPGLNEAWREMESGNGFTLIELTIVVVILAVIAAISVPMVLDCRKTASETAAMSNVRSIATKEFLYYLRSDLWTGDLQLLGLGHFADRTLSGYRYTIQIIGEKKIPPGWSTGKAVGINLGMGKAWGRKQKGEQDDYTACDFLIIAAPQDATAGDTLFYCDERGQIFSSERK